MMVRELMEPLVEEHPFAVLISVGVSLFFALLGYANVCAEQSACIHANTCYKASNSSLSCAFRNRVSPAGWKILNTSDVDASMAAMLRGVCAPGLRQNVDPLHGTIECTRMRSYPNAMNLEIEDLEATVPHRRYCGAWIDAGTQLLGETKWAFYDADDVEADVHDVLSARSSARVGSSAVSRFRSSCRSMISTNAQGPAGEEAFQHLAQSLHAGSLEDALESVGFLGSHYCDAPAQLSLAFSSENAAVLHISSGVEISENSLDAALYAVGDSYDSRQRARDFADAMASIPALDIPEIDAQTAVRIAVGSHQGTWLDATVTDSYTTSRDLVNLPLGRFRKTAIAMPTAATQAYLRGLAAYCAFSLRGVVTGEFGAATSAAPADLVSATALGRLDGAGAERLEHVHEGHFRNATRITWGSLQRRSLISSARSQARSVCLEAAQKAFPDAFDADTFDVLVPDALYERLEPLTAEVRASVENQLDGYFAQFFTSTKTMRRLVGSATVRVAGAPRGSWAGLGEQRVEVEFGAHDGALLMLLKQGRSVFLNRMTKVVNRDDICSHPPLYAASERNAYLLVTTTYACVMMLPGILVPPFAHPEYDDESLRSRIGYVIAHELSHVTALTTYWKDRIDELLHLYSGSTWVEAIADLVGVAAVRDLGVGNETLCGHVSQLWCARSGLFVSETTHPRGNARGDNLCEFLS